MSSRPWPFPLPWQECKGLRTRTPGSLVPSPVLLRPPTTTFPPRGPHLAWLLNRQTVGCPLVFTEAPDRSEFLRLKLEAWSTYNSKKPINQMSNLQGFVNCFMACPCEGTQAAIKIWTCKDVREDGQDVIVGFKQQALCHPVLHTYVNTLVFE